MRCFGKLKRKLPKFKQCRAFSEFFEDLLDMSRCRDSEFKNDTEVNPAKAQPMPLMTCLQLARNASAKWYCKLHGCARNHVILRSSRHVPQKFVCLYKLVVLMLNFSFHSSNSNSVFWWYGDTYDFLACITVIVFILLASSSFTGLQLLWWRMMEGSIARSLNQKPRKRNVNLSITMTMTLTISTTVYPNRS